MRRESGKWAPSQWTERRVASTVTHAYKYAELDLYLILGDHAGALAAAQIRADMASEQSADQLRARGHKTIGELASAPEVT